MTICSYELVSCMWAVTLIEAMNHDGVDMGLAMQRMSRDERLTIGEEMPPVLAISTMPTISTVPTMPSLTMP